MNYPLISEYIEAIKSSEDNLNQLNHLRPVLDDNGEPVMSSGNFAVVFKMKDEQTGKFHAVKCFLKEQEGRAEAYKEIAKELENVSSTFLTPIKYYENELFVDSNATEDIEFPVLLMDWVEGVPLDKYVRDNIDDSYELELLTWNFKLMATWLLEQPFAHGDLKPDNIIVRDDGTLVLVDYDGMYVPAMEGQSARELGSPDFRHPQRTEQDFDKRIDDFPIVSIVLSLKAIALKPELLERYGVKDRLLFSEADYRNLGNCRFVKEHFPSQSPELDMLYALFLMVYRNLKQPENTMFSILDAVICQPEINKDNFANEWIDKYGAKYSADRKRLLKGPNISKYYIPEGTNVIESYAFKKCENLQSIVIPDSVTQIGDGTFLYCYGLQSIVIPNSVTQIGKSAFLGCISLQSIVIPDSVTQIENGTFMSCISLQSFVIPDSVTQIGDSAFYNCDSLQSIVIPDSVTQIGYDAFYDCDSLQSIVIPDSVTHIGYNIFTKCNKLLSITVAKVNKKYDSRDNCNAIIETASNELIVGCATTRIPDTVTRIGYCAFGKCENLQSIVIPNSVTQIGDSAFYDCVSLQSIGIPDSVTHIGDDAFSFCISLQSIGIPKGSKEKFQKLLPEHKHLLHEQ